MRNNSLLTAVFLPAVAGMAMLALVVGVIMHLSTSRSDTLALDRQTRLVHVALRHGVQSIGIDQEASTVWDDAVTRVHERPLNLDWIDNNLGIWFYTYYHHDETYLVDRANKPIYAMQAGVRRDPDAFARIERPAMPLIQLLRARLRSGQEVPPDAEGQTIGITNMVLVDGRPAFVSVKPVVSETGKIEQVPGSEVLHLSVRYVDGSFLKDIERKFGLDAPTFSFEKPGDAAIRLRNRDGRTMGYISWQPFRPGTQIEQSMLPVLAVTLMLIGATLLGLLLQHFCSRRDLEESNTRAQHLAFHDPLTGLPNRAHFRSRLDAKLEELSEGGSLAVLLLDLDRFKIINDAYGHAAGDAVICQFGARLSQLVGDNGTIGRLGGDEFAVVLNGNTDAATLCAQVIEAVSQPCEAFGQQLHIGVSIGVSFATGTDAQGAELLRTADIALYRAKEEGRNCYRIFDSAMDSQVALRQRIEEELRRALTGEGELKLFYQPIIGSRSKIIGFEALIRWQHEDEALRSAGQFIPIAEETGLIVPLGEWVMREASLASLKWPDAFIAVNLSPLQCRSTEFAGRLLQIVHETGADPRRMQLEITERVLLDDDEDVLAAIRRLREAGFRIVLEDFGTGYSALKHLRGLRLDKLKIDRSFVQHLGSDTESSSLVAAILALSRALGMSVAAEGVETSEQRDLLLAAGCMEMQGHLFGKAVPKEQASELLATQEAAAA